MAADMVVVDTAADMAIAAMAARALAPDLVDVTSVTAEGTGTVMGVVMAGAASTKKQWRPAETWGALKLRRVMLLD